MRHPHSHPVQTSSRLAKFAVLVAETAIVTAIVSIFAISTKAHAGNVPNQVTPAPSSQALKDPGVRVINQPLDTVEPATAARQTCYNGERLDCSFRISNTEKLQRFNETLNTADLFISPSNPPLIRVQLFELPL